MTLADETVVRAALKDYEVALFEAVLGSWEDWKALLLGGRLQFPARSRACLVHDFAVGRMLAAFANDANVHVVRGNETVKVVFAGQVALRFKKANDKGLGSNIETQATMEFVDQQQQLPGLPDVHKVEMVYRLNKFQTQIDRVEIVARDGDVCLWGYALTPASTNAVVPLQFVPADDAERGARVKVKSALADAKKESRD